MKTTDYSYQFTEYPLTDRGISLFLECMKTGNSAPNRNILLIHGSTNSSHVFDINYEDYSLARRLAREGYAVWRLDIAGYGRSGDVLNGFLPRMDYAAENIHAAADLIARETGNRKIDLLGWSWGTMTTGRFAVKYPEYLNRLVLYAPLLTGIGDREITESFYKITWESLVEDFQLDHSGNIDVETVDPAFVKIWCSSGRRYNKVCSPNACRLDYFVSQSRKLIDLEAIPVPTLIICGDKDPYMDYRQVYAAVNHLPEGSAVDVIPGGSHIVMYEKPFYHEFQNKIIRFLER